MEGPIQAWLDSIGRGSSKPTTRRAGGTQGKLALLLVMAACGSCCQSSNVAGTPAASVTFQQELEASVDFDLVFAGESTPSLRLLAPEQLVTAEADLGEQVGAAHLHTLQGRLTREAGSVTVKHAFSDVFECQTTLRPRSSYVDVEFSVQNKGTRSWRDLKADFCLGLTRLPSESRPWANRAFFPDLGLDRSAHGDHWFSIITPKRLKYFRHGHWQLLHPSPQDPDPSRFPAYNEPFAGMIPASMVALESGDGQPQMFMMWNVPSEARRPFPGNACMHLVPLLAEQVQPGKRVTIRGKAGFAGSSLPDLIELLDELTGSEGGP